MSQNAAEKVLILTVGLPRSGKSTWAMDCSKRSGSPVVYVDAIRLALHGQAFAAEAEPHVWAIAKTMVHALFLAGHSTVILDATNCTRKRRDEWKSQKWVSRFKVISATPEECIRRAKAEGREDLIPVIERMALAFEPLSDDEFALS